MRVRTFFLPFVAALLVVSAAAAQEKAVSASDAWIAAPAAGADTTAAYVNIDNPTMYDVYVTSVTCEAAASVEMREAGAKPVKELTVPAFGSVAMAPDGPQLLLKGLKRTLAAGDSVPLTLSTDGGITLKVDATVR